MRPPLEIRVSMGKQVVGLGFGVSLRHVRWCTCHWIEDTVFVYWMEPASSRSGATSALITIGCRECCTRMEIVVIIVVIIVLVGVVCMSDGRARSGRSMNQRRHPI